MPPLNYEIINLKEGRDCKHLYYKTDKCLYKKNGKKGIVQHYICIDKGCKVTGKLVDGEFVKITKNNNYHIHAENHEEQYTAEKILENIKKTLPTRNLLKKQKLTFLIQKVGNYDCPCGK